MHRLSGGDIQFIYQERDWRHLHTMKVLVLDAGSSGLAPVTVDRVRDTITERLGVLDPLRWRLQKVPGHLYHPLWIDGGAIDVSAHVRGLTAPAPGDDAALAMVVSQVASVALRRDRPLWEMVVVSGLADDRVALVWKLHHAIADGSASLALIERLLDTSPDPGPQSFPPPPPPDEIPGPLALARGAAGDLGQLAKKLPGMTKRLILAAARGAKTKSGDRPKPAPAFIADETRFNRKLLAERSWSFVEVPLDAVQQIRQVLGGTVNDVFLALTSTVVRDYLSERGELPAKPMSAAVPTSIRHEVADTLWGNFPSTLFITLATDIEDPLERYEAIKASQAASKAWHDEREHALMYEWMEAYPFWFAYTRMLPAVVQRLMRRPSFGLIASNVKGPSQTLYFGGAPLSGLHSMGPLVQELGLNVTAWSYRDRMSIGVHACHEHVPDLPELAARFGDALTELEKVAASAG